MYCQLVPAHRVWIYLKRVRFMFKSGCTILGMNGEVVDSPFPSEDLKGPEDAVAKMWEIFLPGRFPHVMYHATINHLKTSDPDFGVTTELTLDNDGLRHLKQEHGLAFGHQGSICDCGIPDIQNLARRLKVEFMQYPPSFGDMDRILGRILTPEHGLEMAIRGAVSEDFRATIGGVFEDGDMMDLVEVLLEIVYPVFGFRGHKSQVQ